VIDRIRDRQAFARLRREGTHVRSGALWCSVLPDPALPAPAVAWALGRSVGNAVARNRLRRRLREVLRTREARLGAARYLVGARPEAVPMTWDQLSKETDRLLDACAARTGVGR
jgi:ribonuclease P protein component